ncbi:MAG: hypothetical protein JNL81_04400 [Hyphomonadaceae bacterium]|nr:hypothetical protein [Hyphomonadaceae bacterium]
MRALVDANVIRKVFACIAEPHALKRLRWGKSERISVVMRASHTAAINAPWEAQEILYVPPIFEAARDGSVALHTSDFLEFEIQQSPPLRSDFSRDLFQLPCLASLKDPSFSVVLDMESPRLHRAAINPPESLRDLHTRVLSIIGAEKTFDAAHILTAVHHKIPFLLTMDRKLRNGASKLMQSGIPVHVMLPSEFGAIAGTARATTRDFQCKLHGASIFRSQKIVPLAERTRYGAFGLLATPYQGVERYSHMSDRQVRWALKVLREQIWGRKILRSLPLSLLWTHGEVAKMRTLTKMRKLPIQLG